MQFGSSTLIIQDSQVIQILKMKKSD
ncbi:DUF2292 domain-containing protein [Bacillus norwichensis]